MASRYGAITHTQLLMCYAGYLRPIYFFLGRGPLCWYGGITCMEWSFCFHQGFCTMEGSDKSIYGHEPQA